MSKNQWIVFGLAAAIIVFLALLVLGVVVQVERRRKVEADPDRANKLRQEATAPGFRQMSRRRTPPMLTARHVGHASRPRSSSTKQRQRPKEAAESRDLELDHHRRAIKLDPDHGAEANEQRPEPGIPVDDQRS